MTIAEPIESQKDAGCPAVKPTTKDTRLAPGANLRNESYWKCLRCNGMWCFSHDHDSSSVAVFLWPASRPKGCGGNDRRRIPFPPSSRLLSISSAFLSPNSEIKGSHVRGLHSRSFSSPRTSSFFSRDLWSGIILRIVLIMGELAEVVSSQESSRRERERKGEQTRSRVAFSVSFLAHRQINRTGSSTNSSRGATAERGSHLDELMCPSAHLLRHPWGRSRWHADNSTCPGFAGPRITGGQSGDSRSLFGDIQLTSARAAVPVARCSCRPPRSYDAASVFSLVVPESRAIARY